MNRRLRELQQEIMYYNHLINTSEKESDKQIYKGKVESLEREQKQILKKKEE